MLPIVPEPFDELSARFQKAVEICYAVQEYLGDARVLFEIMRPHVFDTPTGIRLIVSKEKFGTKTYIHFSGSVHEHSYAFSECNKLLSHSNKFAIIAKILELIVKDFRRISGIDQKVEFCGFSENGVPHFVMTCN